MAFIVVKEVPRGTASAVGIVIAVIALLRTAHTVAILLIMACK